MADDKSDPNPLFSLGQQQASSMMTLQKEMLGVYEQFSHEWVTRAQTEAKMWTELAKELTAIRSLPEAMESYSKCLSLQFKMASEDNQKLLHDLQQIIDRITRATASRS